MNSSQKVYDHEDVVSQLWAHSTTQIYSNTVKLDFLAFYPSCNLVHR